MFKVQLIHTKRVSIVLLGARFQGFSLISRPKPTEACQGTYSIILLSSNGEALSEKSAVKTQLIVKSQKITNPSLFASILKHCLNEHTSMYTNLKLMLLNWLSWIRYRCQLLLETPANNNKNDESKSSSQDSTDRLYENKIACSYYYDVTSQA